MSLDAACSIFVSQTLVIGRDGCYLEEEMDVEKFILLVKDHEAIYDASRCEHRNRRLTLMVMFISTKTTAPLTTVIMFLLLLGLLFKVCVRFFLA